MHDSDMPAEPVQPQQAGSAVSCTAHDAPTMHTPATLAWSCTLSCLKGACNHRQACFTSQR